MSKKARSLELFVLDILVAIDIMRRHVENLDDPKVLKADELLSSLIIYQCIVIGETLGRILKQMHNSHKVPQLWRKTAEFGSIFMHDYFAINHYELLRILHEDIPKLKLELFDFMKSFINTSTIIHALHYLKEEFEDMGRCDTVDYLIMLEKEIKGSNT
jgi:uncharacterized protein with HEPN domain